MEPAKKLIPSQLKGKLMEFGTEIRQSINEWEIEQSSLKDRRKTTREMVKGVGQAKQGKKSKRPNYSSKLILPRITQRAKELAKQFNQPEPVFSVHGLASKDTIDAQQKVLQIAMGAQQLEAMAQEMFFTAFQDNSVVIRVMPQDSEYGVPQATYSGPFFGPLWQIILVDHFVVAPNIDRPLFFAVTHGHMYDEANYIVEQKIKNGLYLSDVDAGMAYSPSKAITEVETDKQGTSLGSGATQVTRMFDCLHRHIDPITKKDTLYRVIMQYDDGRILRIEPWNHTFSPYEIIQKKDTPDKIFAEIGVAQQMCDFQSAADVALNEMLYNMVRQSRAPFLNKKGNLADSVDGLEDEQIINVRELNEVQVLPVNNSVQYMAMGLQMLIGFADQSSHANATITGGESNKQTATGEQIAYQGFQTAVSGDILDYARPLVACARKTLYWCAEYWDQFQAHYQGSDLEDITAEALRARSVITITGQNPSELPAAQAAVLQNALALFAQVAAGTPELAPVIMDVVKRIVENLPFNGKRELLEKFDEAVKQMEAAQLQRKQMEEMMMQAQMQGGLPQPGQEPQGDPMMQEQMA
jgi:hypothetical protein